MILLTLQGIVKFVGYIRQLKAGNDEEVAEDAAPEITEGGENE